MPVDTNIALTTLELVKSELNISDTSQDSYLTRQINVVSEKIANYCNRNFRKQTYNDEKYTGNDLLELNLDNYPITSVTEIKISDNEIELTDIEIESESGILYYEKLFKSSGYVCGISRHKDQRIKNVTITYEAGYQLPDQVDRDLPYDLEDACINEIVNAYEHKGTASNLESWTLDKATKKFTALEKVVDTETGFLLSTKSLLDSKYRRWII